MNRNILCGVMLLAIIGAGCARKPMPVPYPQQTDPAEPVVTSPEVSGSSFDEDASPVKQGPPPLAAPDLSEETDDLSEMDSKYKPLSAGFVNDRIRFYQGKLELWKQVDQQAAITSLDTEQTRVMVNCFRDLQTVLGGYKNVHSQIFQQGGAPDTLNLEYMIGLQRQDIAFLESRCAQLLAAAGDQGAGPFAGHGGEFSSIEQRINELYKSGAFDQVVQTWSDMPSYQKEGVSRKTALAYADALIYLNDPARAAETYEQVVDSLVSRTDQQEDLLSLRRRLGDLYAAAGNFFAAETQYEQLLKDYAEVGRVENWAKLQLSMLERSMKGSPELTDYSELMRGYLGFVPSRDGYRIVYQAEQFLQQYPYSPVSPNVDIIKDETSSVADQWFLGKINEADLLVETKKFEEAIALLQSLPQDKLSPENLLKLKEKLDSLVLAEAVERETVKIEMMQALQSTWNEGASFAESGDYDAAIAVFSELKGTEYNDKAQERIDELSLTAAKIERRRAADLFVRSMKTDDLENRKQLLIESRQVLKDILRKYPDVDVAEKVEGNIRTVEKKMNELDPILLPELEEKEKQQELLQEPEFDGFDMEPDDQSAPQEVPTRQSLPVLPPQS
ncbi:MAG: hypothetical protein KJO60_15060 [Desulfofustis sp.]|nr:hypothetical protein [Desulfofustis sp.]NNK57380.1 hypothetical protein [Desulfofustis sp.]